MRNLFKLALLIATACMFFGCAQNYYSIPQDTLDKTVKTVGVAPFFTDADSDIRHPEKATIGTLIQGYNAKYQKELIARLRASGTYYAVRQVDGDPTTLFSKLVSNRERRDDAGVIYNKYFYKKDEVKKLMSENGLDAILLVTVSGLTRPGKVYSSNFLSYLDTDFNYLSMTAQMLDRDGNAIWEYPNFRRSSLSYPMLFSLQYPDFDEAAANLTEKVDVKFKTVQGITAAFNQTEASATSGPPVPVLYAKQYDDMLSLLKKDRPLFGSKSDTTPPEAGSAAPAVTAPAPATPAPAAAPARPAATAPAAPATSAYAPLQETTPAPARTVQTTGSTTTATSSNIVPEPRITSSDIIEEPRTAK